MKKVIFVKSIEDLENIRNFKDLDRLTIILLNDIYFDEGYYFSPINMSGTDVVIYGFNNSINSLTTKNKSINYSGLFSEVKSLYVKNLRMYRANINANEVCGILAGRVAGDVNISGVFIDGVINCDAIGGGIVGICKNINVNNSYINTTFNARGALGGLAAMADDYSFKDSYLNACFNAKEYRLIDHYVAYLGKREGVVAKAITVEANDHYERTQSIKLKNNLL